MIQFVLPPIYRSTYCKEICRKMDYFYFPVKHSLRILNTKFKIGIFVIIGLLDICMLFFNLLFIFFKYF